MAIGAFHGGYVTTS